MEQEPGQVERRLGVVGQRRAQGQAVAAHRLGLRVVARRHAALNVPDAPRVLLEIGFGRRISSRDRLRPGGTHFFKVVELAELVRHSRQDLLDGETDRLLCIRDDGVDRDRESILDLTQQRGEVGGPHAVEAARQQHRARQAVAHDPQHILRFVRLQPVDRQDHVALLREALGELRVVGETQGEEFLVAGEQVGDGALGNGDALVEQGLMDLGNRAMVAEAQAANAGDDVEAELVMGQ